MKRKMKIHLNNQEVEKEFLRKVSKSDIVASFYYSKKQDNRTEVVTQYFDVNSFSKHSFFLFILFKKNTGMLIKAKTVFLLKIEEFLREGLRLTNGG